MTELTIQFNYVQDCVVLLREDFLKYTCVILPKEITKHPAINIHRSLAEAPLNIHRIPSETPLRLEYPINPRHTTVGDSIIDLIR